MGRYRIYRMDTATWPVERLVFLVAGIFVTAAAALTILVDPRFVWASCLFGGMLVIFATTGFCPMAILIHRLKRVVRKQ